MLVKKTAPLKNGRFGKFYAKIEILCKNRKNNFWAKNRCLIDRFDKYFVLKCFLFYILFWIPFFCRSKLIFFVLTKISSLDQNFECWSKFLFLTKICILTKLFIFPTLKGASLKKSKFCAKKSCLIDRFDKYFVLKCFWFYILFWTHKNTIFLSIETSFFSSIFASISYRFFKF